MCFQTEPALMYDSVHVFATGLQTLEQSHTLKLSNISCEAEVPWDGGLSLINYINSVTKRSGPKISFESLNAAKLSHLTNSPIISSHGFINNVIFSLSFKLHRILSYKFLSFGICSASFQVTFSLRKFIRG